MDGSLRHDARQPTYREVSAYVSPASPVRASQPDTVAMPAKLPDISVVGLDQIGVVATACLSHLGFRIIGVDIRADRTSDLLEGNAQVSEPRLERLLLDGVTNDLISSRQNLITAVLETDLTLLMAPQATQPATPRSATPQAPPPTDLVSTSRAIGQALAMKSGYHVVVLMGEAPHGALSDIVRPEIERASGKCSRTDFGLCVIPAFGRAGASVSDFFSPAKTVIGSSDRRAAATVARVLDLIDANAIHTTIETAEMAKRADALWQATRMAFDADVAGLCAATGIDGDDVMDIFRRNARTSFSPDHSGSRNRAGAALGPDLRAMAGIGGEVGISLPLVESLIARLAVRD